MNYGGKVFRVVTENHPGCPVLAAAGAALIRTEYVTGVNPLAWGLDRAAAFFFPNHLDAVAIAKDIPHAHATVDPVADNNLRAVSASSTGAVKQADDVFVPIHETRDAPRPQNSLPVPVLAGAQPARPERAGHCASVRGSTRSLPANVKLDPRGGQILSKRSRSPRKTPAAPRDLPDAERFWWRQGQMA